MQKSMDIQSTDIKSIDTIEETIAVLLGMVGIALSLTLPINQLYLFLILGGLFFIVRNFFLLMEPSPIRICLSVFLCADIIVLSLLSSSSYCTLLFLSFLLPWHALITMHHNLHLLYCLLPILFSLLLLLFNATLTTSFVISCILTEVLFLLFDVFQRLFTYNRINHTKQQSLLISSSLHELRIVTLNKRLAYQNTVIERTARLKEREDIGRTIHNAVGHTITTAIIALDAAQILAPDHPEQSLEKVEIAKERIQQSLASIRQAVRLFDQTTTKLSLYDLDSILIATISEFTKNTSCNVRHNLLLDPKSHHEFIDVNHSEFLNGALLEAFSNGLRHGHATTFVVIQQIQYDQLIVTILDNGVTDLLPTQDYLQAQIANGYGLKKMRTYLENCGGDFRVTANEGFELSLTLPLIQESEELPNGADKNTTC